jgi:hypothetical protein
MLNQYVLLTVLMMKMCFSNYLLLWTIWHVQMEMLVAQGKLLELKKQGRLRQGSWAGYGTLEMEESLEWLHGFGS